jgi:hypothetical protein
MSDLRYKCPVLDTIIRTSYIYVSNGVGIRGHFSKSKGVREQKSLGNIGLRNSQFSTGAVGWLPRATLETPSDSLHSILSHVRSFSALACTQISCFLELPIPPTDALSTRWINSVTSAKLTLHWSTDSHFENCSTQNAFYSTVAIFSQADCRGATISRRPSKTASFRLSFGRCLGNTRLMDAELCLFEIGWTFLNNLVYKIWVQLQLPTDCRCFEWEQAAFWIDVGGE